MINKIDLPKRFAAFSLAAAVGLSGCGAPPTPNPVSRELSGKLHVYHPGPKIVNYLEATLATQNGPVTGSLRVTDMEYLATEAGVTGFDQTQGKVMLVRCRFEYNKFEDCAPESGR